MTDYVQPGLEPIGISDKNPQAGDAGTGAGPAASSSVDPLRAIASAPPALPDPKLRTVLGEHYGLEGELQSLLSERDQNCMVTTAGNERFILKIANVAEDPVVTDFQVHALLHLEARDCPVATPRIVPTLDGSVSTRISDGAQTYICRVVTYLAGGPIAGQSVDERTAFNIGSALASVDLALADFAHPGDNQPILWDMQRALELRPLLKHVPDTALRDRMGHCIDEFEANVLPYIQSADRQVIHGDLNPGNVLLAGGSKAVAGIIDFGDMVRAPLAVDLAIAASYLRTSDPDPLALIVALVAGYTRVSKLTDEALLALHCMIRTRLLTSITLLHWRLQARGDDDAYSAASVATEDDAAGFLAVLNTIGADRFLMRLQQAING